MSDQLTRNGAVAAVAHVLREGGKFQGLDAEDWADVILGGGEAQDVHSALAALLQPDHIGAAQERERLADEISKFIEEPA